jgi:hypothetical protein
MPGKNFDHYFSRQKCEHVGSDIPIFKTITSQSDFAAICTGKMLIRMGYFDEL